MPTIDTKGLPSILSDQATAAQASAGRSLDYSPGSILRALAEGFGAVALWLQAQLLRVLATTRLATSSGADVDSFIADFGTGRVAAGYAQGSVTLSRNSAAAAAFVPTGSLVRTSDGTTTFRVTPDPNLPGYSTAPDGYTIPAGTSALSVPVIATTEGAAGNVNAGTVTLLASALSGVDSVNNASPMAGGSDAEKDEAAKARFPLYLASLSKATEDAVAYAVSQVQVGIRHSLIDGADPSGAPAAAHFLVVVDDGAGNSPPSLISRVYTAVDAVRGLGISFDVVGATVIPAAVSLTLTTGAGVDHAAAIARVSAAVQVYLSGLRIGERVPFTRLAQVAYAADPGVTNVSSVTLNGATDDLVPDRRSVAAPGVIAVA